MPRQRAAVLVMLLVWAWSSATPPGPTAMWLLVAAALPSTPARPVEVNSQWLDNRTVISPRVALAYQTTYALEVGGSSQRSRQAPVTAWTVTTAVSPPLTASPFILTFDDCGTPQQLQAILAALAWRHLTAVFFPTGVCRDRYPLLVPTLLALGHRVCNHTYSHPFLTRLSNDAIRAEIANGVHAGCDLFRPPYGAWDGPRGRVAAIAASLGYRVQMWDVDTRDWAGASAPAMVAMIRARGGVVLMHMHGRHTAEAILML